MHSQPQISLHATGPPLSSSGGRRIHRLCRVDVASTTDGDSGFTRLCTDYFICRRFPDKIDKAYARDDNQLTIDARLKYKNCVKLTVASVFASFALVCLVGCSWLLQQPTPASERPPETAKLERKTEVFTGKVVLVDGAYRLSLLKDPDTLLRLTRARRESEFAQEQVNLRKYYQKTISVNGTLQGEWIFGADIVGQWTPPGGDTGPNIDAPKQSRP